MCTLESYATSMFASIGTGGLGGGGGKGGGGFGGSSGDGEDEDKIFTGQEHILAVRVESV